MSRLKTPAQYKHYSTQQSKNPKISAVPVILFLIKERSCGFSAAKTNMDDTLLHRSTAAFRQGSGDTDYATIIGAACAFGLVLLAIILGGSFISFFDFNGLLIVLGGTIGATLINHPLNEFSRTLAVVRNAFFPDRSSAEQRVQKLIELATRARNDGLLSLEKVVYHEPDAFLRKAIQLLIDGMPVEDLRRILEIELYQQEDRHRRGAQLFQTMGMIAPAMGLIGTLIGLVQMLQHLNDPAKIGPGMATALLTTFYGALLSYVLFLPLAGKLRARSQDEIKIKELTIEGILAIAKDINPRLLEQRLLSFLPPELRFSRFE